MADPFTAQLTMRTERWRLLVSEVLQAVGFDRAALWVVRARFNGHPLWRSWK